MREILVYLISGLASLFIFAYSVHMFVGGLVSIQTEITLMAIVVMIAAGIEIWLIRDAMKRRPGRF